jgi:RIO kinase 1
MTDELEVLIADGVIDEILGRLKSGKEANISLVRRGEIVLAAKVYKDRATRSFKNNSEYKEGRKVRNSRTQRAMDSGGRFGRNAAEEAWKSAEADALYKLVGSGVRVPEPVMFYEGVLLMDLVRDAEGRPAPRLIDVAIERDAAIGVYADLLAQMISMLCCDLIHGDLSPYNILMAADGPTIIDFPQVVSAVHSSRAEFFFLRDFDNVVRFLAGFDPSLAVHTADGRAIWRAYVSRDLTPQFVPPPPPPPRRDRPRSDRGPRRFEGRPQPSRDGGPQQQRDGRWQPPQASRDGRPQPQQSDGRSQPPRDGRSQPPRDGRVQPPRDGRVQPHDGGTQSSRDGRPQQQRDGRPQQQRDDRSQPPHDGRSQPHDGGRSQPHDGGPQSSRDGRPQQQRREDRSQPPHDGRSQPPRDGRSQPPHDGPSQPTHDGRPHPSRDGRPQQPWQPQQPRQPRQSQQPRADSRPAAYPSQPRAAPPPRPAPPPRRPAPVIAVRWSEDGPKNVTPSGGRRRPKRRW